MSVEEIQKRARSGPIYLLSRRGAAALIGLASTVTIARLLSPRDYGLAAMSAVVLAFVQVFRDFGLTNATLRKGHIEEHEVNFLFWFNIFATCAIALIIAIASPWIADFFDEPEVRNIILVSLVGFVVGGCSLQHNALLKRDLRFGVVAAIETFSLFVGFLVGVTVAFIWRNYWAVVAYGLVQAFVSAVINVWVSKWRPGVPRMIPEARELFKFGTNSTIFSTLNFVSRYASTIIIGHSLGSVSLGHFNRAYNLFQLPLSNLLQPIIQATLPVLARLRPHPLLYRQTYLGLVERLSCTLVPASVLLVFIGVPLVHVMLGEKWTLAGILLSVLAPGLAVYGTIYPVSDLLISQGRGSELRTTGIYDLVLRVAGTLIGAYFGLVGAAAGFTMGTVAMLPVRIVVGGRKGPVTAPDQWRAILPSVPIGIGTAIGCGTVAFALQKWSLGSLGALVAHCAAGGLGAVLGTLCFGSSRRAVRDVILTVTGRYKVAEGEPQAV
jgi:PST family polysaccharide transporter